MNRGRANASVYLSMTVADSQTPSFDYRVAGVRIVSPQRLSLPDAGFHDCHVTLHRADSESASGLLFPHVLDDLYGVQTALSDDGSQARIGAVFFDSPPDKAAVIARQLAPFAAALQGRLTLHAACIVDGDRPMAFVGRSGIGKSTLAHSFGKLGAGVVSDDLLPIRCDAQRRFLVPVASGTGMNPLDVLCFPERVLPDAASNVERLSPFECMQRLLLHGFGELRHPPIWRMQFEAYGALARRTPAYLIRIPDRLGRLTETIEMLRNYPWEIQT